MRRSLHLLPSIVAASIAIAWPAQGQAQPSSEQALRQRVEDLEHKLERLERLLDERLPRAGASSPPPTAVQAADPQSMEAAQSAAAAQPGGREAALQWRVDELDQQVKTLGSRQETDRAAADARARETPIISAGQDGFRIKSPDNAFSIRFGAHLQVDSRWFFNDAQSGEKGDEFLLRRVRPIIEGNLYEKFGFRIMPDFAGSTLQLLDAYVDANLWPDFKIRAGKFKGPVGWERLQSPATLLMMERAFPTRLVPNRDIGVQLSGEVLNGTLAYQAGIFDGAPDDSSVEGDSNDTKDFEARVIARPFRNSQMQALRGLRVGIAYTNGIQEGSATNSQLPRIPTPGQNILFAYAPGAFASGTHTRIMPQFHYGNGPFGLFGEYVVSRQGIERATNRRQVTNTAWQLTTSYLLTGEDATLEGVRPRRNFDPKSGQWGALEIVGRISELDIDDDMFRGPVGLRLADPGMQVGRAREYGIGLNWYLSRQYRVTLNYEQTRFDGGAAGGRNRDDERVLMTRFQLWL